MRASAAASLSAAAAGQLLRPGAAGAQTTVPVGGTVLPPYVGAGSTAAVRPFALHKVTLGAGLLKEKQERMLAFARAYDERRFLVLFNQVAGRPNPPGVSVPGGWEDGGLLSGHWTGHFLTMLAQAASGTGEAVFADKLGWMVNELGACQDALTGGSPCTPATSAPSPRTSCCASGRRASPSTAPTRPPTPGRPGTRSTRSSAASSTPTT